MFRKEISKNNSPPTETEHPLFWSRELKRKIRRIEKLENPFDCKRGSISRMVTRLNITAEFCFKIQHSFFTSLPDFDECASSQNNDCHKDGICYNTRTHFYCGCQPGFLGDGRNCTGENLLFICGSFHKWTTINCRDKVL